MLYIYHHIYSNYNGDIISKEQKERIYNNIHIEFKYIDNIVSVGENEWSTILKLYLDSKEYNEDDIILYIHTKGSVNNHLYNCDWRELLESELIDNYYFYIDKIKMGFDTAGCLMGIPYWSPNIYGGNFWYISVKYLKTITQKDYWNFDKRHSAENDFIQSGINWKPYNNPLIDFNKFPNLKKFMFEEMHTIFKYQTNTIL